ncbi:MAG: tetratricopeptide repeat protein [Patescibacteria group bacterium]
MGSLKYALLDKVAFWSVFAAGALMPIFFLPIGGVPVNAGKTMLVSIFVLFALALWLIARLADGSLSIPKSLVIAGAALLFLSSFVAAIVSPVPEVSLVGQGVEIGTFSFTAILVFLLFLSSVFFANRKRMFYFYGTFLISGSILTLYQLVRLFAGADVISFGIFTGKISSLLGGWNDLAIFFGAFLILSLLTVEFLSLPKALNFLLYAFSAISLFFLALINFPVAWLVVGVVSLALVVYGMYADRADSEGLPGQGIQAQPKIMVIPLFVAVISAIFFFASSSAGSFLSNKMGISQIEVRPSFTSTLEVAKEVLKTRPLFGSGPNRFSSEWLLNKPDGINSSLFWNTDFTNGIGYVPTSLVTHGVLGFASWIIFLLVFLYAGFRAMFNFSLPRQSRYLVVSSFIIAAYLLSFAVLYTPNTAMYALGFFFAGLMIAASVSENLIGRFEVKFLGSPKLGFISVLLLIFLTIGTATAGYFLTKKFVAFAYFGKSIAAANSSGNLEEAEASLGSAIRLSEEDLYYRALSELNLIKLNNLVQQTNIPQDKLREQFQLFLGLAVDSAKRATELDKTNYGNFMALARVYEAVVSIKITGAYDAAKDSYAKALALNPESPAILLGSACLEVANENIKEGRAYIDKALAKKENYTEAVFFLSQLEAREGNTREAIKRTEQALLLAPNEITVLFQLGLLKYNDRDYKGAVEALSRAVELAPNYSNAKYFLGLSYEKIGEDKNAVKQFEEISALNPDNEEVKNILSNLRAGRAPLANVPPPNNKPETRAKLPVKESN